MPRPVHFEIHTSDPARSQAFYQAVFDWEFKQWGEMNYWMINTGPDDQPGIHGGLVQRMGPEPTEGQAVNAFVCTVRVESVDAYLEKALQAGAVVAHPKMPVPGVGWLAYIKDPDGNLMGMMQDDPAAA